MAADPIPAPSNETASKAQGQVNADAITKLVQPQCNTGMVETRCGDPLVYSGGKGN
jgi:hypothetical protein